MKKILFSFFLLFSASILFATAEQSIQLDSDYTVSWEIDESDKSITFELTLNAAPVWLGFGIAPSGSMTDADIAAVYKVEENGSWMISDMWAETTGKPSNDTAVGGEYNLRLTSFRQASDSMSFRFNRKWNTGDSKDNVIDITSSTKVIWAYGSSPVFGYHQRNRGSLSITFSNNTSSGMPDPTDQLRTPAGFQVKIWNDLGPTLARTLAMTPKGNVIVGSRDPATQVTGLITSADGLSVQTSHVLLSDGDSPNGVAVDAHGALFVAEVTRITRWDDIDQILAAGGHLDRAKGEVIFTTERPPSPQHAWKYIIIGPHDGKVYTSVNSPCNTCLYNETYGELLRLDGYTPAAQQQPEILARGIRDTQGFDFQPETFHLAWTDNGWDQTGNYRPPDEVNLLFINETKPPHFGFPFCMGGGYELGSTPSRVPAIPDPEYNPSGDCSPYVPALLDLVPHAGALGIHFYQGSMFPVKYRGLAFIAEHGSWNRQPPIGYRLTTTEIPKDGKTAKAYSVFLQGFLGPEGVVSGRPVDFLELPDGSLLFSDDYAGRIWRITYQ